MVKQIYYKATRAYGVSGHDPNFVYHLGANVHPNPDKKSKDACGIGIHLAKSISIAKDYVPKWKEIYEAEAGVILGEDARKVRCASCNLLRLIASPNIVFPYRPSLNDEWVEKHCFDVTQANIQNQTLEIHKDGNLVTTLKVKMRKQDARAIIKNSIASSVGR